MKGQMRVFNAVGSSPTLGTLKEAPSLADLQKAVGGSIEIVFGFNELYGRAAVAYCNEEGKLDGLPLNESATKLWRDVRGFQSSDVLVGNVVVLTGDAEFMASL